MFGSLKPFFGSYNRVFLYRLDLYGRCDFPKWWVYGRSCWRRKRQRKLRKRRRFLWAAMFFRLRQGQSPQRKKHIYRIYTQIFDMIDKGVLPWKQELGDKSRIKSVLFRHSCNDSILWATICWNAKKDMRTNFAWLTAPMFETFGMIREKTLL